MTPVLLLAVLLVGCIPVEKKTVVVPGPPLAADLPGTYAVAWRGGLQLLAVAELGTDSAHFSAFPCRPPGDPDEIGGVYEYDQQSGELMAELKTIGGDARLAISGTFRGGTLSGSYEVLVLGSPCDRGSVTLSKE